MAHSQQEHDVFETTNMFETTYQPSQSSSKKPTQTKIEMKYSINDNGTSDPDFKIYKIMLRYQNKIEKRQTKIDNKLIEVDQALHTLESQKVEIENIIELDKQTMLNENNSILKMAMQQYNTNKNNLCNICVNLQSKIAQLNTQTSKEYLKRQLVEFDAEIKKQIVFKPQLKYHSNINERDKDFREEKSINKLSVEKYTNKIVFVDGVLTGVVPLAPDTIDLSVIISNVKNIKNKIRVTWNYQAISQSHLENFNISKINLLFQLKNMFCKSVQITDMNVKYYDFEVWDELIIYSGNIQIKNCNENGWSEIKCIVFKFDQYGNKLM